MKIQQLKKYLLVFFLLMSSWFVIHSIVIVVDGVNDDVSKTDVGVVLGNKVERNGEPSERLKARLDKAAQLYEQGYFSHVIVSGGVGKEGFDEAEVMNNYLIEAGVDSEHIITDSNGYNTTMTAANAKQLMDERELDTATIITQYYHITRTKLAFKKEGFDDINSAHAEIIEWRDPYSIFREFFAFYKYLVQ